MQWETILFWAGTGVLFVTTAISQTDWKHRFLIWGLLAIGGACLVLAALGTLGVGPYLANIFPRAWEAILAIASSPASWFSVLILALSANLALKSADHAKPSFFTKLIGARRPSNSTLHSGFALAADPQSQKVETIAAANKETALDAQLLLHFNERVATLHMLDHLLNYADRASVSEAIKTDAASEDAHNSRRYFIRFVGDNLRSQHYKRNDYETIIQDASVQAEERLESTPVDQRPSGIDHLTLRKHLIACVQFDRILQFLREEKQIVESQLLNYRVEILKRLAHHQARGS